MAQFGQANAGSFESTLRGFARRYARMGSGPGRDIMQAIGAHIAESTDIRIEHQVDVDGRPLAPVSERYARWKQYGTTSAATAEQRAGQLARYEGRVASGRYKNERSAYQARQRIIAKWRKGPGPRGRRGGFGNTIWVLTGASRQRITVMGVTTRRVKVVINTPYSGYVNDGTANMPPRRILGLSRDDKREIVRLLQRGLVQAARGKGGYGG